MHGATAACGRTGAGWGESEGRHLPLPLSPRSSIAELQCGCLKHHCPVIPGNQLLGKERGKASAMRTRAHTFTHAHTHTHGLSEEGKSEGGVVSVANKCRVGPPYSQSLSTTFLRLRCEPRHGPGQTMRPQESEIHAPAHRCLQSQAEQPRAGQGCRRGFSGHPGLPACLHSHPSSPHPAQDTRDLWPSPWALPTPVHPHAALCLSRTQIQSHSPPPTPPHDLCKKVPSPCSSLGLHDLNSPLPQPPMFSFCKCRLLLIRCCMRLLASGPLPMLVPMPGMPSFLYSVHTCSFTAHL